MRSTFYAIAILALLATVACNKPTEESQQNRSENCEDKNPMLSKIFTKIGTAGRPKKASKQFCSGLWESENTCCDEKELRIFAGDDKSESNQAVRKILTITNSTFNLLQRIPQKKIKNEVKDMGLLKLFNNTEFVLGQKDNLQKCADYTIHIRNSALCSICSGQSEKYFKDGKAIIALDSCIEMATHCADFLGDLRKILQFTGESYKYVDHLTNLSEEEKEELKNIDKIEKEEDSFGMSSKTEKIATKSANSTDFKKAVEALCPSFYRLLQPTWIQLLAPIVTLANRVVESSICKPSEARVLLRLSNWGPSPFLPKARFLETNPFSTRTDPFTANPETMVNSTRRESSGDSIQSSYSSMNTSSSFD